MDAEPHVFENRLDARRPRPRYVALDAAIHDANASVIADELPDVVGDRSQLVQLLMNLVGNAIKYRGVEAPRVRVAAQTRGEDWLFEVRDNGIGIAPKHQHQVFEIFKRLHDQKEYPGTGIGLAICRRVVDRHGGTIWVESSLGDGSAFLLHDRQTHGESSMNDAAARGRPAVILIADDNDNDIELTRLGFQRAKFTVELITCQRRGVHGVLAQGRPLRRCTDARHHLARSQHAADGWHRGDAGDQQGRGLKHLVIVVMTSSKADEDVLRSYKLRCSSYLVKPITFEAFAKMIQSLGDYWFTLVTLPPANR